MGGIGMDSGGSHVPKSHDPKSFLRGKSTYGSNHAKFC
jgi:hypothetical protein